MVDKIWEYIKMIPLFVNKWANIALQWLQAHFGSYVVDFFDSIGIPGCAVILILALLCWVILFKKAGDEVEEDDGDHASSVACGWIGLLFYCFLIIWIVGMLTHPLNDTGSWLLNDVFEQKALISFSEGTTMLPKLPDGSSVTLDNFLYWHDLLAIGAVFVMLKFALTTIASVLRLRLIKLVCFLIITLSCVVGGMMCGGVLSLLAEADSMLTQLLAMPVFMAFYFIPAFVVWIPVAVVYGGPVVVALCTILSPFLSLMGFDYMPIETTEHVNTFSVWNGYSADHFIVRDHTGAITSVFSFYTFFF